jgi:hypothetical protein
MKPVSMGRHVAGMRKTEIHKEFGGRTISWKVITWKTKERQNININFRGKCYKLD